jgi:hypothetical protein
MIQDLFYSQNILAAKLDISQPVFLFHANCVILSLQGNAEGVFEKNILDLKIK